MIDQGAYMEHGTNLSADVEPFVPRSDVGNMFAEHMINQQGQTQLPHYLTSCYPFVQDQSSDSAQRNESLGYFNYYNQNRDARGWPQVPPGSNAAYSQQMPIPNRFNTPPPQQGPPSNIPHPSSHSTPIYSYHAGPPQMHYPGVGQSHYQQQYGGNTTQQMPHHSRSKTPHQNSKRDSSGRKSAERKQTSSKKRSVGIQMEMKAENDDENSQNEMVDYAQQTDFPSDIASKTLKEKPSPLRKNTRSSRHRRRAPNAADQSVSCDSSDNNGDEADVDSDSGYYSPKHQISRRNHQPVSVVTREGTQDIGAAVQPNYSANDLSPQRVVYLPPSTYYHVQPNQFVSGPPGPGQIIRLPSPGTPPVIMTPPPMMNIVPGPRHHSVAVANFKSRSTWDQEVLKAHNVAPIGPPAFVPRHHVPYGQNRVHRGGQHGWRHPRYQGPRPVRHMGIRPGSSSNNSISMVQNGQTSLLSSPGMIHLNPSTAPQHLVQQNPPQLTDEEFPDLRPAASAAGYGQQQQAAFSYSAALQNKPKPVPDINVADDSPIKSIIEPDDSGSGKGSRRRRKKTERAAKAAAEEYAEISKEQENIKKQLDKKTANRNNKSITPHLDLDEMLSKLEKKHLEDNKARNQSQYKGNADYSRQQRYVQGVNLMPHNPLDSSAPMKKRGKEREIPKVKKPSALKKVILKEREERKNTRVVTLATEDNPPYVIPSVPSDYFNSEITQKDNSNENVASDRVSESGATSSDNQSPVTVSVSGNSSPNVPANIPKIHSRRYREYCTGQVLDKQIDEVCIVILQRLVQFQERMYQKDPIKAKTKRRFVLGIREVTKHLKLKKLRCVLISPNLEKIQSKGGLDDALQQILQLCKVQSVPYVFALGRCAMGRAVSKLVPVSIIGIFDYSGVEDSYKKMLELVDDAQKKYREMMSLYQQETVEANATPPTVPPVPNRRFPHMGHSRNPSAASCVSYCSMISEPISEIPAEGTNWRNMMEVTDEQNPIISTSTLKEDDQEVDESEEQDVGESDKKDVHDPKEIDADQDDYEDTSSEDGDNPNSSNMDSYLQALDNSGSLTSEDKNPNPDLHLDKSFSTVSTIVARAVKDVKASSPEKLALPGSSTSSDTNARINSWLEAATSSVGDLEIEDESHDLEPKLDRIDEDLKDEDVANEVKDSEE